MTKQRKRKSRAPGLAAALRNNLVNWNVPLPLHVKVAMMLSNTLTKARTRSTCCGHPGEPGC